MQETDTVLLAFNLAAMNKVSRETYNAGSAGDGMITTEIDHTVG